MLHLLKHFRQVLTSKKNQRAQSFASRCGLLDTYKNILFMKQRLVNVHAAVMTILPRMLSGDVQASYIFSRLVLIKWLLLGHQNERIK